MSYYVYWPASIIYLLRCAFCYIYIYSFGPKYTIRSAHHHTHTQTHTRLLKNVFICRSYQHTVSTFLISVNLNLKCVSVLYDYLIFMYMRIHRICVSHRRNKTGIIAEKFSSTNNLISVNYSSRWLKLILCLVFCVLAIPVRLINDERTHTHTYTFSHIHEY